MGDITVVKDEMRVRQYRSMLYESPDMQKVTITKSETASNNSIIFNLRSPSGGALLSSVMYITIRFQISCNNANLVFPLAAAGNNQWNAADCGANVALQDMYPLVCNCIQNLNIS